VLLNNYIQDPNRILPPPTTQPANTIQPTQNTLPLPYRGFNPMV